jgi:hypothetical protein
MPRRFGSPATGIEPSPKSILCLTYNLHLVYFNYLGCIYTIGPGYGYSTLTGNLPLVTSPTATKYIHIFDTYSIDRNDFKFTNALDGS